MIMNILQQLILLLDQLDSTLIQQNEQTNLYLKQISLIHWKIFKIQMRLIENQTLQKLNLFL